MKPYKNWRYRDEARADLFYLVDLATGERVPEPGSRFPKPHYHRPACLLAFRTFGPRWIERVQLVLIPEDFLKPSGRPGKRRIRTAEKFEKHYADKRAVKAGLAAQKKLESKRAYRLAKFMKDNGL